MYISILLVLGLVSTCIAWVPPGMSERAAEHNHQQPNSPHSEDSLPNSHHEHHDNEHNHDHNANENVADLVKDTEHLLDDMGEVYTEQQLNRMEMDERVFTWFQAHDNDEDGSLDGLELLKALSHDHNYHHELEDSHAVEDEPHDPAQHTDAADRQRFRRIVKAVDKLLGEDDINNNGYIEYSEFMAAFTTGKLDKVKIKKT